MIEPREFDWKADDEGIAKARKGENAKEETEGGGLSGRRRREVREAKALAHRTRG